MPDTDVKLLKIRCLNTIRKNYFIVMFKKVFPEKFKRALLELFGVGISSNNKVIKIPFYKNSAINILLPNDKYWSYYADSLDTYEPEIAFFLDHYLNAGGCFIDCGSNVGIWSMYASLVIGNPDQVAAVEPTHKILGILRRNSTESGLNFRILPHAIWKSGGERLEFNIYKEDSANSLNNSVDSKGERRVPIQKDYVTTITLDYIYSDLQKLYPNMSPIIVKLDVEGAEINALAGARKLLLRKDVVIIYEDHGKDENCIVSNHIMNTLGMMIYCFDHSHQTLQRMHAISEIKSIKTDPAVGYNFFATTTVIEDFRRD